MLYFDGNELMQQIEIEKMKLIYLMTVRLLSVDFTKI
jgi:hypothetical protein